MLKCFIILIAEILLLLITCLQSQGQTCDNGWFGYPSCKYKCHCDNNVPCDNKGTCSGTCKKGWFGPACQYADLTALNSTNIRPAWLYDSDDSTCNWDRGLSSVAIELSDYFPVTWIRLIINSNDSWQTAHMRLLFLTKSGTISCTNQSQFAPTTQILDIHCDLQEKVDQIILEGSGVQSLCSVYISGGRNVALKQRTSQTSTLDTYYSFNAVDGNNSRSYLYCAHTVLYHDSSPTWSVNFTSTVQINRYVLYGREECCAERLRGFIITSFDARNHQVFIYKDQNPIAQDVYTVTSATQTSPIDRVNIQATYIDHEFNIPILTLCEVELYGDSFCDTPKYGRECENPCNCYNNEPCFVSTGGCPNGCAEGYYGEVCSQVCPDGYYGINCRNVCSAYCTEGTCNKVNGTCSGCKEGKIGSMCNECPVGLYGSHCSLRCNVSCGGDGSCEPNTGDCSHGCDDGYSGDKCEYLSGEFKFSDGIGVGVGVGLGFVFIVALVIGVLVYRRKTRALNSNNERPITYENPDISVTEDHYDLPRESVVMSVKHHLDSKSHNEDKADHYEEMTSEPVAVKNVQYRVDAQSLKLDDNDPYEQIVDKNEDENNKSPYENCQAPQGKNNLLQ